MHRKKLKTKYQSGGSKKSSLKKTLKFGLKGIKPFIKGALKRVSGPAGMILGATDAYAQPVVDPKTGVNRFTGEQTYTPFGQGTPTYGGSVNVADVNRDLSAAMSPMQTGGFNVVDYAKGAGEFAGKQVVKKGLQAALPRFAPLIGVAGGTMTTGALGYETFKRYGDKLPGLGKNTERAGGGDITVGDLAAHSGLLGMGSMKQMGGMRLPGGVVKPIPGSDAVEFEGQTHDEGGIMMDSQTEVEDGETMDQVNMAKKGGKRDYFFSSYLKKGGKSFADMHKEILRNGGDQEEINMLARMQEKAAGRNPNKVAKLGGIVKYQTGGALENAQKAYDKHEANKPTFDLKEPKFKKTAYFGRTPTAKEIREEKKREEAFQKELEAYNAAKAEYEAALAEWETKESELSDAIEAEEMLLEQEKREAEEKAAEEERIAQEKADMNQKAIDLNKKAKQLGIDINAEDKDGNKLYVGPGGGLLPSKLDAFEKAVTDAETALKAKADELGIEYDENTKLSKLRYNVTEAGYEYQGGMEGDELPGGKGVTETQDLDEELTKKLGLNEVYLEDEELKAELMREDWTVENWMATLDQELLEQAGITDPSDWNDRAKVIKYQEGLDEKYGYNTGDKKGNFKGLVGEKIFRSAPADLSPKIQLDAPEVTINEKKKQDLIKLPQRPVQLLPTEDGTPLTTTVPILEGGGGDRFYDAAKDLLDLDITNVEDYEKAERELEYNEDTDQWERKDQDIISVDPIKTLPLLPTDTEDPELQTVEVPEYTRTNVIIDEEDEEDGDKDKDKDKDKTARVPTAAYLGMAAGVIPAAFSLLYKQPAAQQAGYTRGFRTPIVPERGVAPRLERYDYNQDIANVGAEVRGMNKYIETSGGGPANMINKMMAFSKGQDAKAKIRAAETRANIGVQNTEAQLEQQMTLDNLRRSQQASIINAQMIRAEAARKDQIDEMNTRRRQKRQDDMEYQKYAGVTSLAQSLQQGFGDILDYKADIAMAEAIGSDTGVYQRSTVPFIQGLTWDEESQSFKIKN